MNKQSVSKFLILGFLSAGLIACGMPNGSGDDMNSNSSIDPTLSVDGGHGKVSTTTKSTAKGTGTGTGGGTNTLSDEDNGFDDMSAEFADDNTIEVQGKVSGNADTVAFVINGEDKFEANVNADRSFSIQIGITAEDKRSMVVAFVYGGDVKNIVLSNDNLEILEF